MFKSFLPNMLKLPYRTEFRYLALFTIIFWMGTSLTYINTKMGWVTATVVWQLTLNQISTMDFVVTTPICKLTGPGQQLSYALVCTETYLGLTLPICSQYGWAIFIQVIYEPLDLDLVWLAIKWMCYKFVICFDWYVIPWWKQEVLYERFYRNKTWSKRFKLFRNLT